MRFRSVLVVTALAGAGLLAVPQAASADPATVTLASSAVGPTSGAATATTAKVTVQATVADAPVENAVFTATVPGTVEADAVTFDGGPTEPGAVTVQHRSGPDRTEVTANIGFGANALQGGDLVEGETYPITVTTTLSADIATPATATAKLAYDDGGTPDEKTTSAAIPLPDVAVSTPKELAQGPTLSVTPDGFTFLVAQVDHRGPNVAASTLTLTVPRGLSAADGAGVFRFSRNDDEPTPLKCRKASATTLTCDFGALTKQTYAAAVLVGDGSAEVGDTGTLSLSVTAANGLDATPADNTVSTTVRFVAPAKLRTKLTTDDTRVEIGGKARVTVSVTNEGTEAVDTFVPLSVFNVLTRDEAESKDKASAKPRFEITDFSGKQEEFDEEGLSVAAMMPTLSRAAARTAAAGSPAPGTDEDNEDFDDEGTGEVVSSEDIDDTYIFWTPGSIAPGQTATAVLTVQAKRSGRADVNAEATGAQGIGIGGGVDCLDEADYEDAEDCPGNATLELRAVAASASPSSDDIADTGAPTGQLLTIGFGLVLLGGLSLYAGRRQVTGRHRPVV